MNLPCTAPITAKLAISIARKVGAIIFVVPEDLIEGRQRLVSHETVSPPKSIGETLF